MKTKGEIRKSYLRYLDEATKKGVELPESKNADYRDKFDYFLDPALKYISTVIKIPEVYQITQYPIQNLMGTGRGFETKVVFPESSTLYTSSDERSPYTLAYNGMQSYYFEVNSFCTIIFYELVGGVWTQINAIENAATGKFTAHKGNLTLSNKTNQVKVEFSSNYPFVVRNIGLFDVTFPSDNDVPTYTPFVAYDMPSNFLEFDNIVLKSDPKVYMLYTAYKWENNKKAILNYDSRGSFDIHYFKYPNTVNPSDSDETEIDIEEKVVDLVALQTAVKATAADNPDLSKYLRNLFLEELQNAQTDYKINETTVQTVYYMG